MFDWLRRKIAGDGLPGYAAIRALPSRGLPSGLEALEAGPEFAASRDAIEQALRTPPRRPSDDGEVFVTLIGDGVLTLTLPDGGRCVPVFSSPARAQDYNRVHLAGRLPLRQLMSTPLQLVAMLRDLRASGVECTTLDVCPRCTVLTVVGSSSIATADAAIAWWSIAKASELSRMDLYLAYAERQALGGAPDVARDVAFEAVAHVGLEDPRAHWLLGQVAVAARDRATLREARAFLRFLKKPDWEHRLAEAARLGCPEFAFPADEIS